MPASALAVPAAATVAGFLGGRAGVAALAAAAALAGATLADARLSALDGGRLAGMSGRAVESRVVILEPVRDRSFGRAVARVRLLDGSGAGEQAVLRLRRSAYRGDRPGVGDIVQVRGVVEPLGRWDAYQRRRNAHAAIAAAAVVPTGERRGGPAGRLDGVRRRAEAGLASGLAPPEAALMRGMVLGEDERLSDAVRDDFQRSGLAHILAVSGQNVMLLAALVLAACALTGVPLRARLLLAAARDRGLRPARGRRPVDPARGRDGDRRASRCARRQAGAALVRAPARRRGHARAQPARGRRARLAALVRGRRRPAGGRGAAARRARAPACRGAAADAAAITIAATVGTAPLMAFYFEQVSLAALPANLLAAPAIAPVMWLGVLAAAAAQIAAGARRPVLSPRGAAAALSAVRRPRHRGHPAVRARGPRVAGRDLRGMGGAHVCDGHRRAAMVDGAGRRRSRRRAPAPGRARARRRGRRWRPGAGRRGRFRRRTPARRDGPRSEAPARAARGGAGRGRGRGRAGGARRRPARVRYGGARARRARGLVPRRRAGRRHARAARTGRSVLVDTGPAGRADREAPRPRPA